MNSFDVLVSNIEANYKKKLAGGHIYIPFNCFDRFSDYMVGVVKSSQWIITASSGVGKSKFTRYVFVQSVLAFTKVNPEIKPIIIVFSLELAPEEYIADIICSFLKEDFGISISYRQLLSINDKGRMNQDIIDKIKNYADYIKFFNEHVHIYSTIKNPYGIYKTIKGIIEKEVEGTEDKYTDEYGNVKKYYKYKNDNIFIIPIIDHISLITPEFDKKTNMNMDLRQAMSKLSSDYLLELKNYYQTCNVIVQQQTAAKEAVEHNYSGGTIDEKLEPSMDALGENKTISRDATDVVGIFAPERYGITKHPKGKGYNISILGDNYRSVKMLKSRYGAPNKKIGMLFDGATGTFTELPSIDNINDNLTIQLLAKINVDVIQQPKKIIDFKDID